MSDFYWEERYFALKRWIEHQSDISNITNVTEKDWVDFWYNSESEGLDFKDVWQYMEKIEPLTPIQGENNDTI